MVPRMRLLFPAALVLLAVAPAPAGAAEHRVELKQFSFQPDDRTINVGDSVRWDHQDDGIPHNVKSTSTPAGESFNSGHPNCASAPTAATCMTETSPDFVRTFDVAGTYAYVCEVHQNQNMTGVIRVQAQSSGTTSTTPLTTAPSGTPTTAGRTGTTAAGGAGQSPAQEATTTSSVAEGGTTTTLEPGEAPDLTQLGAEEAGRSGNGGDEVGLAGLVGVLALVASGGGLLLWRLRPGG